MTELNLFDCYDEKQKIIEIVRDWGVKVIANKTLTIDEKHFMILYMNKKIIKSLEAIETDDNYNDYDLHYKKLKNEKFKILKIKMG